MRPHACDKKLQEEWVVPLKSVEDIQKVQLPSYGFSSLWSLVFER